MSFSTQFMINRELQSYRTSLQSWARGVRTARTPVDAFRMASHRPHPGSLIRSMSGMFNSDRIRAEREVEEVLQSHVDALAGNDPHLLTIMRLAQGHWPLLYRKLDEKRRAGRADATNT
jgi:hypothetical protein